MFNNGLHIAQCAYESDRIVLENQKIRNLLVIPSTHGNGNSLTTIKAVAEFSFDNYLIGLCICNHGGLWNISTYNEDGADFLIEGLHYSDICIGKIQKLDLHNDLLPSLVQVLLREHDLQQLNIRRVTITASSVDIIHDYISNETLKAVQLDDCEQIELLLPIVFGPSSLYRLSIRNHILHINDTARKFLMNNMNLKQLDISCLLEHLPCESASLDYIADLVLMSIKIFQSNNTIQELEIVIQREHRSVVELIIKNVENKPWPLNIIVDENYSSSCQSHGCNITQQMLLRIPEQFHDFANITTNTL